MVAALAAKSVSFDYSFLPVNELRVTTRENQKTGRLEVDRVLIKDEQLDHSDRFWVSLFSRYGFNKAFFKYFDHKEVFDRISEIEANDRMRVCIERDSGGNGTVLGVSNPSKPIVVYDELMDVLEQYQGEGIAYDGGIVTSLHIPRAGLNRYEVAGDYFNNRMMMGTPIDGYGAPNIYLAAVNETTQSYIIGQSKTFKSTLALGKADDDAMPCLTRALDSFNNDEGYASIRQRLESADKSWCSVNESTVLYKLLVKLHANEHIDDSVVPPLAKAYQRALNSAGVSPSTGDVGSAVLKAFHGLTGDTSRLYGLANLDALSVKRQRTLPVRCSVLDWINFASEIATHLSEPFACRRIQELVGMTMGEEFDMESTKENNKTFESFQFDAKVKTGVTG